MESLLRRGSKLEKYSPTNSPKLEDMEEHSVDSKTLLYFKKGTNPDKIAERIKLYQKKLLSPVLILDKTEEVLLTHIKKVNIDE